jgi:hypothetical protein
MVFSLLVAVALAGLAPAPVGAADEAVSPAEERIFNDRHLDGLPGAATLRYDYRLREAGRPPVEDEVVLTSRQEAQRGRVVQLDYLHGERHLALPEVEQAVSNPLILHFLEADVRSMRRRLGGQENYFRRRIRLALARSAQLRGVTVSHGGKEVAATQVLIRPYEDDPLQERFKGMARKAYLFTLSPKVPGGVYELRTVVEETAGSGAPLLEETLTLRAE